jgi:cytochrome P450
MSTPVTDNVYTRPAIAGSRPSCPMQSTGLGAEFDPFARSYLADPYGLFARARRSEPVFYSPVIDHWVVSRYADIMQVFRDPPTFSAKMAQSPIFRWPQEAIDFLNAQQFRLIPNLSNNDPPSHTQVRGFVGDAFMPRHCAWLEPYVRRFVTERIDAIMECGTADLVRELFADVPPRVLFVFLGIPDAEVAKVKQWSEGRMLLTWGRPSAAEVIAQMPSFVEYVKYCFELVDRLEASPGVDYMSELIQKWKTERPDGIEKINIVMTLFGLLNAGHESTTYQAGNAVQTLLRHRDSWDELCRDPTLIPNAIEETIRYDSTVIGWRRVTTRDVELGGVTIPKDSQLLLLLASGNRDGSQFSEPDTFDIRRPNARQHLSFGHGIHYCLGAPLARLELRVMLEELARRLPTLRLCEDATPAYHPNTALRGPAALHVEWNVR